MCYICLDRNKINFKYVYYSPSKYPTETSKSFAITNTSNPEQDDIDPLGGKDWAD